MILKIYLFIVGIFLYIPYVKIISNITDKRELIHLITFYSVILYMFYIGLKIKFYIENNMILIISKFKTIISSSALMLLFLVFAIIDKTIIGVGLLWGINLLILADKNFVFFRLNKDEFDRLNKKIYSAELVENIDESNKKIYFKNGIEQEYLDVKFMDKRRKKIKVKK
ncbi:hypothetical protein [Haliovirga abyssi]|uniref:Uncharacterized protein n=1 Tax=Haliovirga abyssi TaxID=2996794 RepID=A0AAU9D1H5_9FUSO|nr:hypothetical protein [Haliovirga abyssi]BDU49819.1 hypothetical protein HLVA_03880 [Haliovirga abyssi]